MNNFRRTMVLVLVVGLLGFLVPAAGEASILGQPEIGADHLEPGLMARFFTWVGSVVEQVSTVFIAQEGATLTTNG